MNERHKIGLGLILLSLVGVAFFEYKSWNSMAFWFVLGLGGAMLAS